VWVKGGWLCVCLCVFLFSCCVVCSSSAYHECAMLLCGSTKFGVCVSLCFFCFLCCVFCVLFKECDLNLQGVSCCCCVFCFVLVSVGPLRVLCCCVRQRSLVCVCLCVFSVFFVVSL